MNNDELTFRRTLVENGIVGYDPDDIRYLIKVAKICAVQAGIPMAGAVGVATASAGTVVIPGIGAVPGYVAGALAGFLGGTFVCTIARGSLKRELDKILKD